MHPRIMVSANICTPAITKRYFYESQRLVDESYSQLLREFQTEVYESPFLQIALRSCNKITYLCISVDSS